MKKKVQTQIAKCLCGGIKIKTMGKLRYVINCHCKQCMKTHGNFAAYTNCLEENIIFMNKSTLRWYNSSNFAKRGFCNKCGASIFYKKYLHHIYYKNLFSQSLMSYTNVKYFVS